MPFYFAYGSNMNPARMADRGLAVVAASAGQLKDTGLRFNKRSRRNAQWACANIAWSPGETVEGVLYQLADTQQIVRMDPFEGAPFFYSRERFAIDVVGSEPVYAWTYVANRAHIDNNIKPLHWYLAHLLAGREYLSSPYLDWLAATPCCDDDGGWA